MARVGCSALAISLLLAAARCRWAKPRESVRAYRHCDFAFGIAQFAQAWQHCGGLLSPSASLRYNLLQTCIKDETVPFLACTHIFLLLKPRGMHDKRTIVMGGVWQLTSCFQFISIERLDYSLRAARLRPQPVLWRKDTDRGPRPRLWLVAPLPTIWGHTSTWAALD